MLCQNLAAINARLSAHDAMKFYKLSGPCMPGKEDETNKMVVAVVGQHSTLRT